MVPKIPTTTLTNLQFTHIIATLMDSDYQPHPIMPAFKRWATAIRATGTFQYVLDFPRRHVTINWPCWPDADTAAAIHEARDLAKEIEARGEAARHTLDFYFGPLDQADFL